jgi:hypothetical protein
MNIKNITLVLSGLFLGLCFSACDGDSTVTYNSQTNDAQIYSFSITGSHYKSADSLQRAMDSIRFIQVNNTKFAIDQISGVIYNPDSLPYGTVLRKKVYVTTTYNPTYGAASVKVITPDSISGYSWNSTDSIDLSKMPVTFIVTSQGGKTKTYNIDIRIHKIDPDTIVWKKQAAYPAVIGKSKTVLIDEQKFYTYAIINGSVSLYIGDKDALSWQQKTVSGLPSTVKVESIIWLNGKFCAVDATGNSYTSDNGESWTNVNNGKTVETILGILPEVNSADEQLLVAVKDGGKYYFGKSAADMQSIDIVSYLSCSPANNEIPSSFPIRDVASFTNRSSDKNIRMLIFTGGLNASGEELNYTWCVKNSSEGLELSPFIKNTFFKGSGLSVFAYDSNLYTLANNGFYISSLWGEIWSAAPNKQCLDPAMGERTGRTIIVDNENYIWVFGGISANGSYSNEVWKGRLNKLNP